MKKAVKIPFIIISVLLALILLIAIGGGALYLYSDAVIFDHTDAHGFFESKDKVNYPWFGNPTMLSEGNGGVYKSFLGGGDKNIGVYMAVNDPISDWVLYLSQRYGNSVTLNYTLEQDSKSISVRFAGTAYDDNGSAVPLDQSFLFDIENAAPDNLPKWLNEDDMTNEYMEYLNFVYNQETVPMPAWYAEKMAA